MVLQIWDTAGQERFRALNKTFYKNSLGAMVIFDLSDRKTFERLDRWMTELKDNLEDVAVSFLVNIFRCFYLLATKVIYQINKYL